MKELGKIIGQNLKNYRTHFGFNQDHVAEFLQVDRSTISLYESAEREISIVHLNRLADLFGVELEDLVEESEEKVKAKIAFAFRSEGLDQNDLSSIAAFQKVVKNYLQMKKLSDEQE